MFAYVGCRTTKERNAYGKGIKVFEIVDGKWELRQLVEGLVNPSFQCLDETGNYLYSIHGDFSQISAFRIDKTTGKLKFINMAETGGMNPVHLSIDKTNKWVYVANLETGTVAVITRNNDGSLKKFKKLYKIKGLKEETYSHPHQVIQDASRNYLLVSCQGRKAGFGQVDIFKIDHEHGSLTNVCTVPSRELAEPRHMVCANYKNYYYGVNEKDYSLTTYVFDKTSGVLTPKQIIPTLPETCMETGWASGIASSKDGLHIYVSNRKCNTISSFDVSKETGFVKLVDCVPAGGEQPRFITTTPDGKQLIVANELSANMRVFDIDGATGKLHYNGYEIKTENPVCVIFSK